MRDIKHIEKQIERYWECETSTEDEKEIRTFFASNKNLPADLEKWRSWFAGTTVSDNTELGETFDEKILSLIGKEKPKTKTWPMFTRIAASVAATAAITLLSYFTLNVETRSPVGNEEIANAEMQEEYETIKEMLYFSAYQLNRAEASAKEALKEMNVVNEYINIK